jgi:multiple sugar transport system substrate-binding protein
MKHEFIPLTGIHVEWEQLPLDQVLAKVIADTALAAGKHDIFYWDQAWIGRFVNDAIDPRQLMARPDLAYPGFDFNDFLPPLVEHVASYKGQLAAIPFDIPVWIMIYRKDILGELGLSVPATIPEYLKVVRSIHQAKSPTVFGTTEGWKAGHYSLLQKMTTWLWGHGGAFFNHDGTPAINDEKAEADLEYMLELGKNMPPGVTTWDWFGEAASFARGQAGIYIGIGEFFPSYDDPATSRIVGLAEPAPSPAALTLRSPAECGFDETPGMSHHGGSCLAISRYSKNIEAAWVFLQWATSSDVTTRASLLGGGASPIRFSNYKDPRIKEKARVTAGTTRHFDVTLEAILHHLGTEPHLPAWPTLSIDFAVELGKLMTGQQEIRSTLKNMAAKARRAT